MDGTARYAESDNDKAAVNGNAARYAGVSGCRVSLSDGAPHPQPSRFCHLLMEDDGSFAV